MDGFPKMEPNYKYTPHIILFSAIFIFQYFTKAKDIGSNFDPEQKKIGDKIFWKYMIVFQISKAADWCLGPYVFEFFESYHRLNIEWIGRLMALSFLSNLFLGPLLVGYLNDKSDKKFPCLLYGIILSASCLVRQIKSPMAIIMSQIFFGMGSSVLYTSFENWFVAETNLKIKDKNVKDYILSAAFEKSMISDSLTAVFTNFIVGNLRKMYGIQAPYMFSTFLSVISFICISFLLTPIESNQISENSQEIKEQENMHEVMDVIKNIRDCLKELYKQPFIILIGLTESLLFATLHIFIFSWTPTLRQLKSDVDTNEVFTLFMISLMVGGASFRAIYLWFDSDSFKVAKTISLLCSISFFMTNMWSSYNFTLYSFLLYEICVGMLYPTYSKIKSEYLPAKSRGTLMNIFKIPLNLIVIFLLLNMNTLFTLKQLLMINLGLSLVVFITHILFFKKNKKEIYSRPYPQTNETNLLNERKNN